MKKTLLSLFFGALASTSLMAQTQVMNVYKTDGTVATYKVSDVEKVLFEEVKYVSSNSFTVTDAEGGKHYSAISTVFHNAAASQWGDQEFAFGDAVATEPAGLMSGTYAVDFTIAAELVNQEVDLTEHPSPETDFKLWDYTSGKSASAVSGKITTDVSEEGKVYLKLDNVVLSDGSVVDGEYYEAATSVDAIDIKPELQLVNQYAYNSDVTDIKSVVLVDYADYGGYMLAFFKEEGVTGFEESDPLLSLFVSYDKLGEEVDLATGTEEMTGYIMDNNWEFVQPTGTMTVSFDRLKTNVTVSIDAIEGSAWAGDQEVRVEYAGSFVTTYMTSDELVITDADDNELIDKYISSVLRQQPAEAGGATAFGIGDANAATPDGFLNGKYGVYFSVAASKLGGTVDLAEDKDSYAFKLIDYTAGTVDENVASGTITTDEKDGYVYIKLNAVMTSGVTVSFDYFEEATDVEDLSPMIPTASQALNNAYVYYDADGNESDSKEIATLKYKASSSYTTFYFVPEGASDTDKSTTPQLQLGTAMLASGTYDLSALKDGDNFKFSFKEMQLYSPDSKYAGFANVPDNGTLTVAVNEDGTYEFSLEVTNSYTTGGNAGGTNTKVVLAYKGAAVAK